MKEMVKVKGQALKPRTDFAGRQVNDYSTDYDKLHERPGSFTNVKKKKRSASAMG